MSGLEIGDDWRDGVTIFCLIKISRFSSLDVRGDVSKLKVTSTSVHYKSRPYPMGAYFSSFLICFFARVVSQDYHWLPNNTAASLKDSCFRSYALNN